MCMCVCLYLITLHFNIFRLDFYFFVFKSQTFKNEKNYLLSKQEPSVLTVFHPCWTRLSSNFCFILTTSFPFIE